METALVIAFVNVAHAVDQELVPLLLLFPFTLSTYSTRFVAVTTRSSTLYDRANVSTLPLIFVTVKVTTFVPGVTKVCAAVAGCFPRIGPVAATTVLPSPQLTLHPMMFANPC